MKADSSLHYYFHERVTLLFATSYHRIDGSFILTNSHSYSKGSSCSLTFLPIIRLHYQLVLETESDGHTLWSCSFQTEVSSVSKPH